jgi:hypothetical protein
LRFAEEKCDKFNIPKKLTGLKKDKGVSLEKRILSQLKHFFHFQWLTLTTKRGNKEAPQEAVGGTLTNIEPMNSPTSACSRRKVRG